MPTVAECLCCCEIPVEVEKKDTAECIIQHPGFEAVCLNVWVLQTAYHSYSHHYGSNASEGNIQE